MEVSDIERYCATAGGVCVYRQRVRKAQLVVQSMYIFRGSAQGTYQGVAELDALGYVDDGEGRKWQTGETELSVLIERLEEFMASPLADWENVTQTGRVPDYRYKESLPEGAFADAWDTIDARYRGGVVLLPKGLVWKNCRVR